MKFMQVPNILLEEVETINFIYYENERPSEKNKVLFTQNAISFLIEGEKEIHLSSANPITLQNSVALIGVSHCLMSERKLNGIKPYTALLIFFDNSILFELREEYLSQITNHKVNNKSKINIISSDKYLMLYRDFILKTLRENKHILTPQLKKIKLLELLTYLMDNYPEKTAHFLRQESHEPEIHFKSVVEYNSLANLNISELAFLCNMSESTFIRQFRKYYNTSPQKWFLNERMNFARHLLLQGKKPSTIYKKVGYKTLSNFSRAYKKHFGTTPKMKV